MNWTIFSSTPLFLLLICLTGGQTGWSVPLPQLFSGIDEEEEIRIGREAARQVERENRLIRNRRLTGSSTRPSVGYLKAYFVEREKR